MPYHVIFKEQQQVFLCSANDIFAQVVSTSNIALSGPEILLIKCFDDEWSDWVDCTQDTLPNKCKLKFVVAEATAVTTYDIHYPPTPGVVYSTSSSEECPNVEPDNSLTDALIPVTSVSYVDSLNSSWDNPSTSTPSGTPQYSSWPKPYVVPPMPSSIRSKAELNKNERRIVAEIMYYDMNRFVT